jgi:DNA-binding MarR family transcriptional regulator
MKIEDAIQQRTFRSEYQKAHINILYSAAWLTQKSARILRPFGISGQQFNILRILRGMHPEPATVKLLTERMIDKMSNASRLVEKLKKKGLVDRMVCPRDRRRVEVRITDQGLQLIEEASRRLLGDMEAYMNAITQEEARALNHILDKMRECE